MNAMRVALFEQGTPEEPGAALAAYRREVEKLRADTVLEWYVDLGNLGLLSRAVRELSPRRIDVVLRAEDIADDRTHVVDETELVPTLRRLREQAPPGTELCLMMSNGRPYTLPPPALDISTNDLCGLECNMCGNRATRRDPHTMAPEDVQKLIAEAAAWGIRRVALTGAGEPFRDPRMLDHIRFANGLGHLVTITTNGFPISDKIAAALAERVVSVSVSIHGATEETHDAIVGVPKAGENAWRAVRRMVRARDARAGSKLSVNVSTVIQRHNLTEIPALVRRARDEGVSGINVQPVNLQHGAFRGDAIVRRDDLVAMSRLWPARADEAALDAVFDELEMLKGELGKVMHASLERLALVRRYFRDSSRDALGVACRVGEAFLAVDHRGQIKPCYRLPWSHGDARLVDVRALWNSKAYARTRAQVDACPLTCLNNCFFRERRAVTEKAL
jgi:MoaA/NifB/PqqE/SkfB family radical SAM enzyme